MDIVATWMEVSMTVIPVEPNETVMEVSMTVIPVEPNETVMEVSMTIEAVSSMSSAICKG
jgi:hypothetical protein